MMTLSYWQPTSIPGKSPFPARPDGRLLSRSTLPLGSDPSKAVAAMIDCMQRIRDSYPKKSLEGIGVSVPGRVDKESQCLIFAPNLNWPKYDIKQTIDVGWG